MGSLIWADAFRRCVLEIRWRHFLWIHRYQNQGRVETRHASLTDNTNITLAFKNRFPINCLSSSFGKQTEKCPYKIEKIKIYFFFYNMKGPPVRQFVNMIQNQVSQHHNSWRASPAWQDLSPSSLAKCQRKPACQFHPETTLWSWSWLVMSERAAFRSEGSAQRCYGNFAHAEFREARYRVQGLSAVNRKLHIRSRARLQAEHHVGQMGGRQK